MALNAYKECLKIAQKLEGDRKESRQAAVNQASNSSAKEGNPMVQGDLAIVAAEEEGPQAKRNVAIAYAKIGDVQLVLGDKQAALEAYKSHLNIMEEITKKPFDGDAKRDLMNAYDQMGKAELGLEAR